VYLTIRTRLTLWYSGVLAASFLGFFWICDRGFQRSIETTVNDASRNNLEAVRRIIDKYSPEGPARLARELRELADLWANGAIFEVIGSDGTMLFASEPFSSPQFPIPQPSREKIGFLTTNLANLQYRIAQQTISLRGENFEINAAVPTEPFDQALDNFRVIEKQFLPLLVLLACLLGYWLAGRAMAPVGRIIRSAAEIGVYSLSRRLEIPRAHDELRRLTETLNEMLDRVERSVNRITQFTADASHDLRTPLSVIRSDAEIALRKPRTAAEYRESLARILHASEGATGLIESLLTLARADGRNSNLKMRVVDVTPILQKVAAQMSLLAASQGLSLAPILSDHPMRLHGDPDAIEKLLLILLDNAVKYTPSPGFIWLRSLRANGDAVFEVQDTGIGIAGQDQQHIFDRFYRADQARTGKIPGSGLGLAIASWIVTSHQGNIEVQSVAGEGSLFRVRIPLVGECHALEDFSDSCAPLNSI